MSAIILHDPQDFPTGTTVKAYLRSGWTTSSLPPSGAPVGAVKAEAVVDANGNVELAGLEEKVPYFATAEVGGVYRYIAFRIQPKPSTGGGTTKAELEAIEAQIAALKAEIAPLDTDGTLAANSDARVASQKAAKAYVDAGRTLYAPQLPGAMFPVGMPPGGYVGNSFAPLEKIPYFARVIAPRAGVLKDLMCWPKTQLGNVAMAIYDTGDAEAGKRTRLYQSGSVAVGVASKWQVVAESPGVNVKAGQQLDIFAVFDSATVELGRWSLASGNVAQLPANYNKVPGGASPKLSGDTAAIPGIAEFPATFAEAAILLSANIPALAVRVE